MTHIKTVTGETVDPQIEGEPDEMTIIIAQAVISGRPIGAVVETVDVTAEMGGYEIDEMLTRMEISIGTTVPQPQDRTLLGMTGEWQAPVFQQKLHLTRNRPTKRNE